MHLAIDGKIDGWHPSSGQATRCHVLAANLFFIVYRRQIQRPATDEGSVGCSIGLGASGRSLRFDGIRSDHHDRAIDDYHDCRDHPTCDRPEQLLDERPDQRPAASVEQHPLQ